MPYASNSHSMTVVSLVSAAVRLSVGLTLSSFLFFFPFTTHDEELVGLLLSLNISRTG